ncbi:MAG: hypothetical protein ACOC3V_00790 [bacterium]
MKNCSSCRYKKTYFSNLSVPSDKLDYNLTIKDDRGSNGDFYTKCDLGHNDIISKFYLDNSNDIILSCHEDTDISKKMDEMMNILNDMEILIGKK